MEVTLEDQLIKPNPSFGDVIKALRGLGFTAAIDWGKGNVNSSESPPFHSDRIKLQGHRDDARVAAIVRLEDGNYAAYSCKNYKITA